MWDRCGPCGGRGRSAADLKESFSCATLGQVALGLTFALCFQMGTETLGSVMAGGELTWDRAGLADVGGLLFQGGRLDRDRVFRAWFASFRISIGGSGSKAGKSSCD